MDALVRGMIIRALSESLKVSADVLDSDDAFSNYGVDSISGVRLVQTLNERLGVELTPTDLFDYGSVNRLTGYILRQFAEAVRARLAAAKVEGTRVGMAVRGEVAHPPATEGRQVGS